MSKNINRAISLPFSVSQNFLTSSKTIKRLLSLTSISSNDHIIEIGSGKGHITRELVKACRSVDSYEIDSRLYQYLQEKFVGENNLNIKHQDFLKAQLPKNQPYKVFSNIPFSITSEIMRKLTEASNPPTEIWLVMEKGAAKRFAGLPNDNLSSLSIKPFFDSEIKYHFSRQDFHPMPSVDTVLLHLTKKSVSDIPIAQKKEFIGFIQKGVKYGIDALLTKKQIATALKLDNILHIQTSGTMLYVQWLCLFRCYRRFHGGV